MLLYVDTYLSDSPRSINRKLESLLDDVRRPGCSYKKQRKVDIFRYTLASYAPLDWEEVVVNVDGEREVDVLSSVQFAKELFPTATIASGRSDTGLKYSEVLGRFTEKNPWVFFSPHNDHVYISPETDSLNKLLPLAEESEQKYGLPVAILYSHFTEAFNSVISERFLHGFTGEYGEVLHETEDAYVVLRNETPILSTHILRARQLYELMLACGDNKVITTEDVGKYVDVRAKAIQIVPKVECCRHYDGYMHTFSVIRDYVSADKVPPLFIPDGFFDKKIRVRYGYDVYSRGFLNINPNAKDYIFQSNGGTDIGESLSRIPFFWRERIKTLDVNPNFVEPDLGQIYLANKIRNPWANLTSSRISRRVYLSKLKHKFKRSVLGYALEKSVSFIQRSSVYFFLRMMYRRIR